MSYILHPPPIKTFFPIYTDKKEHIAVLDILAPLSINILPFLVTKKELQICPPIGLAEYLLLITTSSLISMLP